MKRRLLALAALACACATACLQSAGHEGEGEGEGEGQNAGEGLLEAAPSSCDFGSVAVGASARCALVLRNRGRAPLVVTRASTSAPFAVVEGVFPVDILPGGVDSASLVVTAQPTGAGRSEGTLLLEVDEGADLPVPLHIEGRPCPTPVIAVARNGVAVEPPASPVTALPTDLVVLDASGSVPGSAGGTITRVEWRILSRGNSGTLTAPQSPTTVVAERAPGSVDIGLRVEDGDGATSCEEATVTVVTIPRLTLAVDDALLLGLEPHVFRGPAAGDERCTALDCFDARGCGFLAATPPEWDGAPGRSAGDPFFDEVEGVRVAAPVDGELVFGIYARAAAAGTTATATLSVDGAPSSSSRSLSPGDFWTIARVTTAAGRAPVLTPVDSVEAGVACGP